MAVEIVKEPNEQPLDDTDKRLENRMPWRMWKNDKL